jgi:hypothetical protein
VFGVELAVAFGQPPAAVRDHPDAAPGAVGDLEDVGEHRLGGGVALRANSPGVGVLDGVLAAFELSDRTADALEDVERFEAGDHDRHAVAFGQLRILLDAHHAADVAGRQEALDAAVGRAHHGLDRRGHPHVRDQHAEVGQAEPACLVDGHRVRRGGGLEPDAEEHHLLVRVLPGQPHGVERRVDHAHVAAGRAHLEQVAPGAGNAEHVAE